MLNSLVVFMDLNPLIIDRDKCGGRLRPTPGVEVLDIPSLDLHGFMCVPAKHSIHPSRFGMA